jgi:hypothetical protein
MGIRQMVDKDYRGGGDQNLFLEAAHSSIPASALNDTHKRPVFGRKIRHIEARGVADAIERVAPGAENEERPQSGQFLA